jgi:hypothetical protein
MPPSQYRKLASELVTNKQKRAPTGIANVKDDRASKRRKGQPKGMKRPAGKPGQPRPTKAPRPRQQF